MGASMVNTRRLEQLLGTAPSSGRIPASGGGNARRLAISGARDLRQTGVVSARPNPARDAAWASMDPVTPNSAVPAATAEFNRAARNPEIIAQFDLLRTQLEFTLQKRGLRSLGITAPHHGAGTSFVLASLAASFARRREKRLIALDLDLAAPSLHDYFQIVAEGPISDMIDGKVPVESHLRILGDGIAIGCNSEPTRHAVSPSVFREMMEDMTQFLVPDIILCDLPPLMDGDSALALLPGIDAVLVVADASRTRAAQIEACERALTDQSSFLGVILNNTVSAPGAR